MLAEAAWFAFLAAISPTALLVMAVFLGSASPRRAAFGYVTGAVVMTLATGVALFYVIRATGLNQPRQHEPRYGLRLALGVIALTVALIVGLRRPRQGGLGSGPGSGIMSRLVATPSMGSAFVAGVILFAPSITFIAAVQVIATANTGVPGAMLGLVIVVAVSVLTAWLPLLAYLLAPDATARRLGALNQWLRAQGRKLAACALAVGGIMLVANGVLGLA